MKCFPRLIPNGPRGDTKRYEAFVRSYLSGPVPFSSHRPPSDAVISVYYQSCFAPGRGAGLHRFPAGRVPLRGAVIENRIGDVGRGRGPSIDRPSNVLGHQPDHCGTLVAFTPISPHRGDLERHLVELFEVGGLVDEIGVRNI